VKAKTPRWIEEREVLAIHDRLLSAHGGAAGLCDPGLLQSALARPRQHYSYSSPNIIELAAIYATAIVNNHPFVDGNKRTGFTVGIVFLELNGFEFRGSEQDVIRVVFGLAAGDLDEAGYAVWLGANTRRARNQ
jgi:death on curing protein